MERERSPYRLSRPYLQFLLLGVLLLSAGCREQRNPPGYGAPANVDERRGRRMGGAMVFVDTDTLEVWKPLTRPYLENASLHYAESLRNRERNIVHSQKLMIEAGHLFRDCLQQKDIQLVEDDRILGAEILFQQAVSFAETNHPEDMYGALDAAISLGFADRLRLLNHRAFMQWKESSNFKSRLAQTTAKEGEESQLRVRHALYSMAPFPVPMPVIRSIDEKSLLTQLHGTWRMIYCMGLGYPPCEEMLGVIQTLHKEWKGRDVDFVAISFESKRRPNHVQELKILVAKHNIDFPVFVGDFELFDAMGGKAAFPSIILLDQDGIARGAISGYQNQHVIRGILEAMTTGSFAVP